MTADPIQMSDSHLAASPTSSLAEEYFYPNKMGRIVLTALEKVLGQGDVNTVLRLAGVEYLENNYPPNNLTAGFRFDELSAIQAGLEQAYGIRSGRIVAKRCGRETFQYALNEFMPVMGTADLAYRPLHLGLKIKIGLYVFAETFNKFSDQIVRLSEEPERHLWIIERCPVCWNRQSDRPCCHLAVGLLEESLRWVSRGKQFRVEEIECVAVGNSACVIAIQKKPVS